MHYLMITENKGSSFTWNSENTDKLMPAQNFCDLFAIIDNHSNDLNLLIPACFCKQSLFPDSQIRKITIT